MRERYTTINHNDKSIEKQLHMMKRVSENPHRSRMKEQLSVRSTVVVNIDQLRLHNYFAAFTK